MKNVELHFGQALSNRRGQLDWTVYVTTGCWGDEALLAVYQGDEANDEGLFRTKRIKRDWMKERRNPE
jgi:hypothetical protein